MSEPEIKLPPMHITLDLQRADGTVDRYRVGQPVCDFCFDVRVRFEYPCADFGLPAIGFGSFGPFVTCEFCSSYIEAGTTFPYLVVRICKSWLLLGDKEKNLTDAAMIVRGFNRHRTGPREDFQEDHERPQS